MDFGEFSGQTVLQNEFEVTAAKLVRVTTKGFRWLSLLSESYDSKSNFLQRRFILALRFSL